MQSTYLDFELKYLGEISLEEKILSQQVILLENTVNDYARIVISPEVNWEEKRLLVEDLLFEQSKNWCLEKYMKPYKFLLTADYYRKMKKRVIKVYKREEQRIRKALAKNLGQQLKADSQFNISGYLYFRAEEWQKLVKEFLAEIYLEIADEIEQENFIGLLQYFVRTQPIILEKVYLFLAKDGSFYLNDEYGHNLREEYLLHVSPEELENVSEVDLLLSILVTLLPQKIYLHSEQAANCQPVKLLQQIFGERIINW